VIAAPNGGWAANAGFESARCSLQHRFPATRSANPLRRRPAGPEPRHFATGVARARALGVQASRDEGRDGRAPLPTGSCASRKRCGDIVKRPNEPRFLLARQAAAVRRRARQAVPRGAEHLKRFLQRCEGLGSVHIASSSFGGAMERVGGLDQCGCGVARWVLGSHGKDAAAAGGPRPWVSTPKQPTAIAHRASRR
jgi:hypothetical protein